MTTTIMKLGSCNHRPGTIVRWGLKYFLKEERRKKGQEIPEAPPSLGPRLFLTPPLTEISVAFI